MTTTNTINLFGATEKKADTTKVEKFQAVQDVNIVDGVMNISFSVSLDLSSPDTLAILEQLKVSESGKGYNCVSAPLRGVQGFSGNCNINIAAKFLEPLKTLVQQNIIKLKNTKK